MTAPHDLAGIGRVAFLTLPNYSMIAVTNALEACRMANYVSANRPAYSWQVLTLDGKPADASNGHGLVPTLPLATAPPCDLLLVCGGIDIRHATDKALTETLHRLARSGITLGAVCTGAFALAEAGLLDGYRSAIHWENLAAVREEFAAVTILDDLFVIDRDRITCTGGIAPLDMMLTLITARLGPEAAQAVSDEFLVAKPRTASSRQPVLPDQPALARAARAMRDNIETPLGIDRIADAAGVSARQLERLFKQQLGQRPRDYYAGLRLDRARELLRQTAMPVTEVALACGFHSAAHFSTTFARHFGRPPRAERKVHRSETLSARTAERRWPRSATDGSGIAP